MIPGIARRIPIFALLLVWHSPFATAKDEPSLFGQTKVWSIQLVISPTEFDAMQPPPPGPGGPGGFGGPGIPGGPNRPGGLRRPGANAREFETSLFNTVFRWAKADFTAEGQTLKEVGIRYAGDITYLVSAAGP